MDVSALFKQINLALQAELDVIRFIPHDAESGQGTERAFAALLRRHLPSRFEVVSGFAVAENGRASSQSDLLVIDSLNCPRLLEAGGTGIYPIDGIVGRIEVTQNLRLKRKRDQDLEKIRTFRSLKSYFDYEPEFKDSSPLGLMVSQKAGVTLRQLGQWLPDVWRSADSDDARRLLPNSVLALDTGLITYHQRGEISYSPVRSDGIICIPATERLLLIWLLCSLGKFRTLIQRRIRAQAQELFTLSHDEPLKAHEKLFGRLAVRAMGGEPYYVDLWQYVPEEHIERLLKPPHSIYIPSLEK